MAPSKSSKTELTQEGEVALGASAPPPTGDPFENVAFSSPADEKAARAAYAEKAKEYFRGEDWAELPNYYCPVCPYASLEGDEAILAHGRFSHPGVNLKEQVNG